MEEQQKLEDRLIAIENDIGGIYKVLKKYNDTISKLQIFIFLKNCDDYEMMGVFLKLLTDENSAKHLAKI